MDKVVFFEKTGEVFLISLERELKKQNIKKTEECPEDLLSSIPKEIVDFCKEAAPIILLVNEKWNGESTTFFTKEEKSNYLIPTREDIISK